MFFLIFIKIISSASQIQIGNTSDATAQDVEMVELQDNQACSSTEKSFMKPFGLLPMDFSFSSTVNSLEFYLLDCEKFELTTTNFQIEEYDSHYTNRSLIQCLLSSKYFRKFVSNTGNVESTQLFRDFFASFANDDGNTTFHWVKIIRNFNLGFFSAILPKENQSTVALNHIGWSFIKECKSENKPWPPFITTPISNTLLCDRCMSSKQLETLPIFSFPISVYSKDTIEKQLYDLLDSEKLKNYTESKAPICLCGQLNIFEENLQTSYRTLIEDFPKLMILSKYYKEKVSKSKKQTIPMNFSVRDSDNYRLSSFILLYNGMISSVLLRNNRWTLSNREGMWDVTAKVQDLLDKFLWLAFYDKVETDEQMPSPSRKRAKKESPEKL